MTYKEAIMQLEELKGIGTDYISINMAVEMAIKALEQEPKCRDCVSRDYLLSIANKDGAYGYVSAHEIINAPSVNPQETVTEFADRCRECGAKYGKLLRQKPKTGHWEWVQYDYNPKLGNWHCSECRCIVVECVDKEEKGGIPLYKYCPQCGAKMQEAEIEG